MGAAGKMWEMVAPRDNDPTVPPPISVGNDGTIYAAQGYLFAINRDGSQKWKFAKDVGLDESIALGRDGTVYVRAYDVLWAINPDGSERWNRGITQQALGFDPLAVGSDGTIYTADMGSIWSVVSGWWKFCDLCAVNPDSSKRWGFDYPLPRYAIATSVAVGRDGTIYAALAGSLFAINPDGSQKWISPSPAAGQIALGRDGTIYTVTSEDEGPKLFSENGEKLDLVARYPDGSTKWSLAGSYPVKVGPDGVIYVGWKTGAQTHGIKAVRPDGSQKWSFSTGPESVTSIAVGGDGTVYAASFNFDNFKDCRINAMKPDGSQKWTFGPLDGAASVALGSDGTIYVATRGGALYALGEL